MTPDRVRDTNVLCSILGYHEVAPLRPHARRSLLVSPGAFASHLAYLRFAGGRCVSLDDLHLALEGGETLPPRAFAITFDDGYVGNLDYALPLLRRFRCTATVFMPSGLLGQRAAQGDSFPVDKMDESQLRQWLRAGMSVGAHTCNHVDLTVLPDRDVRCEIEGAQENLQELLGQPIRSFCYPFGRYNHRCVDAVRRTDYDLAVTNRFGLVRHGDDRYTLPRVTIGDSLALPRFIYRLHLARRVSASGEHT